MNSLATNVYIFPVFSYIGQLVKADSNIDGFVKFLKNKLFGGPGNWLPYEFLLQMSAFGLPTQIRDLHASIVASQARVACSSGLDINSLGTELGRRLLHFRARNDVSHAHYEWHSSIFVINVVQSFRHVTEINDGVDLPNVAYGEAAQKYKDIQKTIYNMISYNRRADMNRIWWTFRGRMDRWKFDDHSGHVYRRAITRFKFLRGKMKPAFIVAFFKLFMNAWNTCERFRTASKRFAFKKCPFCNVGKDSIEHFSRCMVVKRIYRQHDCSCNCIDDFFCARQSFI